MAGIRLKLIQKAQLMADEGNVVMLIFCLKNLAGWADKIDHGVNEDRKQILLKYALEPKLEKPEPES